MKGNFNEYSTNICIYVHGNVNSWVTKTTNYSPQRTKMIPLYVRHFLIFFSINIFIRKWILFFKHVYLLFLNIYKTRMLKDTHVLNYVTENNLNLSLQQIQKKIWIGYNFNTHDDCQINLFLPQRFFLLVKNCVPSFKANHLYIITFYILNNL